MLGKEYNRSTKQGGTYCGTFAPDKNTPGYYGYGSYPRKVMCGKDTMKATGTVTKKLAKWLAEKGYVEDAADAQERAQEATRDLPDSKKVLDLLAEYVDVHAPDAYQDDTRRPLLDHEDRAGQALAGATDHGRQGDRSGAGSDGGHPDLPENVGNRRCRRKDEPRLAVSGGLESVALSDSRKLTFPSCSR